MLPPTCQAFLLLPFLPIFHIGGLQHSSLKTIKKKLIRKALDMIPRIADEDPDEFSNKDKTDTGEASESDKKKGQYAKFWNEFGKSIKLGIVEDAHNRNRRAKFLRFESTKSEGWISTFPECCQDRRPYCTSQELTRNNRRNLHSMRGL